MNLPIKKKDIILAAIKLFVREGFDKSSMDHIAVQAGVSKRTLYKYFSSKQVLLDEIIIYLVNEKQNHLKLDLRKDATLFEQMTVVVRQKVDFLLQPNNVKLGKIILSELIKSGRSKMQIQTILRHESAYLSWIMTAQKAELLSHQKDPHQILEMINQVINGVIFFPVLFRAKDEFSTEDEDSIVTMLLSVLTPVKEKK